MTYVPRLDRLALLPLEGVLKAEAEVVSGGGVYLSSTNYIRGWCGAKSAHVSARK